MAEMEIFVLTFIVICLAALCMAAGVLVRKSELKGSCATLNANSYAGLACEICPARHWHNARKPNRCLRRVVLEPVTDSFDTEVRSQ
jgi:hypothetical protein